MIAVPRMLAAGMLALPFALTAVGASGAGPRDAAVRSGADQASAVLVRTCSVKRQRSRGGCGLSESPANGALGPPLDLRPSGELEVRLPAPAARLLVNVGVVGSDYAQMLALRSRVASRGRTRWMARLPDELAAGTNRILLVATTVRGTDKTYWAAVKPRAARATRVRGHP